MHGFDRECRWCGFGPLYNYEGESKPVTFVFHECPKKPPTTADEGAAVAFGLMGMAEAIRVQERERILEADCVNHDCTCPGSWGEDYCNCNAGLYEAMPKRGGGA